MKEVSNVYKRKREFTVNKEKKKKNERNRKRDIIVNFRMSKEEKQVLNDRIRLSGIKKQDYMIRSSLYQQIVVVGNKRIFDEVKLELIELCNEIKKLEQVDNFDVVKIEKLRTIVQIVYGDEKYLQQGGVVYGK